MQPTKLKRRLALTRKYLTVFLIAGSVGLTACATPRASLPVPSSLREPCPVTEAGNVSTVGDLAAFSVRQEADLKVCDGRRALLVEIIDLFNKITAPPAWQFWRR